MDVDNIGNIFVSGYTTNTNNTKDIVTIKYDNNGNELWLKKRQTVDQLGNCETKKIKADNNGNTYLLCEKQENSINEILTIKYDTQGNKLWEKSLPKENNEELNDLEISNTGEVYLTTKEDNSINATKISYYDKPIEAVTDSLGNPLYVKGEIIIRFDTSVVKKDAVDKIDLQYGDARTFLKDTVIQLMNSVLPQFVDKLTFIKVFTKMTTADSISTTRLGEQVKISTFWTTFRMVDLREGQEVNYAEILDTLYPIIKYAEVNSIGQLDYLPNDDQFLSENQAGLHPSISIPNAHIAISPVWDIETGNENIDIGVYDTGINYKHEDFGDGTYNGSKITGGWDWMHNCHVSDATEPDDYGHGTACAGIIGALRNNNRGIAGIAGGDIDNDNNSGSSLLSMKILNSNGGGIVMSDAADAIVQGAISSGYNLDIMSHSWGINESPQTLREAIQTAFRNNVIIVVSSGNSSDNTLKYPASYNDDWVMKVGANDADGDRADFSTYGNRLDFIAPGTHDIYATLDHNNNTGYTYHGNGTSFSAPHVTGVAALFLSYVNNHIDKPNNLAPEDVEHILENYSTDLLPTDYDEYNGWGRINANESMQKLKLPNYKVRHFQQTVSNGTATLYETGKIIQFPEGIPGLAIANYTGTSDVYKLTVTVNHTIPNTENVLDAWIRNSSSDNAYGYTGVILNPHMNSAKLESYDENSATLSCFIYKVKIYNNIGQFIGDYWFPNSVNNKFAYSLHTYDPTVGIDKIEGNQNYIIYPNPTKKIINIKYTLKEKTNVLFTLFDIHGKKIYEVNQNNLTFESNYFQINMTELEKGIYILKVQTNSTIINKKIIKE